MYADDYHSSVSLLLLSLLLLLFFIPSIEKHRHIASMSLGKTERKLHRLGDKLSSIAAAAVTHFTAATALPLLLAVAFVKKGPCLYIP